MAPGHYRKRLFRRNRLARNGARPFYKKKFGVVRRFRKILRRKLFPRKYRRTFKRARYSGSFNRRVQTASSKNAGLHVAQVFEGYNLSATTSGQMILNYIETYAPSLLNQMGILSAGADDKAFIERCQASIRVFNNSNVPIIMRRVWFKVRKDVAVNVYSSVANMLVDGAPAFATLGTGDPLTSNGAQRYLKWTKMKTNILEGGKLRVFNLKQKINRYFTGDYEGQTNLLFTKGATGCLFFFDGAPIEDGGTPGSVSSGPVSVQITHSHKITWRFAEENQQSSVISTAFPSLSGFGDIVVPIVDANPPVLA